MYTRGPGRLRLGLLFAVILYRSVNHTELELLLKPTVGFC